MSRAPEGTDGSLIPYRNLPPGFALDVTEPDRPVEPRPAATMVLVRDDSDVLLVRRASSAGFVPNAYVFPGGRVDAGDADPELIAQAVGLDGGAATDRLGLETNAHPSAIAYFVAAVRETFEEAGILVGTSPGRQPSSRPGERLDELRGGLLSGELTLGAVVAELGARIDLSGLIYVAHWVTPRMERRRYDTRFFATSVPRGTEAAVDGNEATDAVWLKPSEALARYAQGNLPMVFPTLHTLRALASAPDAGTALEAMAGKPVRRILPRLVREREGIRFVIDD